MLNLFILLSMIWSSTIKIVLIILTAIILVVTILLIVLEFLNINKNKS